MEDIEVDTLSVNDTQIPVTESKITDQMSNMYVDVKTLLLKNGVFIPENKFINEEYFKCDKTEDIETEINEYITSAIVQGSYQFIVINAKFLAKEGGYRKMIYNLVEKNFSEYSAFSIGDKTYIMIIKIGEFYDKIKKIPREELIYSLELIYMKLFDQFNRSVVNTEEKVELGIDEDKEEEEIKKQRLLAQREEEEKNIKIFLPIVQKCEIFHLTSCSSVEIKVSKFDMKSIIAKNRNQVRGFAKKFENIKLLYVVFLYIEENGKGKYVEYITSESNVIKMNNLKANKLHLIKISLKFDKYYSHLSKAFIFSTLFDSTVNAMNYYAWGNNKKNCLLMQTHTDPDAEKNSTSIDTADTSFDKIIPDYFIQSPTRLQNNSIMDYTSYNDSTYLLLSSHEVVSSGKFLAIVKEDNALELEFDQAKLDKVCVSYGDPYVVNFPWGVRLKKVACGSDFCVALDVAGGIYSWGINDLGQLGLNLPNDVVVNTPKKVKIQYEDCEDVFATGINCGSKHVIATVYANEKIKLFSWGLGQGYEPIVKSEEAAKWDFDPRIKKLTNSFSPLLLKFQESHKIIKVISKFNQNAIICKDDNRHLNILYTFGEVTNCQLGLLSLQFPESMQFWGIPTEVAFLSEKNCSVMDVSFSEKHSLFLVRNLNDRINEVYACGLNENFKTGSREKMVVVPEKIKSSLFNKEDTEPIMIVAGSKHSIVFNKANRLFIIGSKDFLGKKGDLIREESEFILKEEEKVIQIGGMKDNISVLTMNIL